MHTMVKRTRRTVQRTRTPQITRAKRLLWVLAVIFSGAVAAQTPDPQVVQADDASAGFEAWQSQIPALDPMDLVSVRDTMAAILREDQRDGGGPEAWVSGGSTVRGSVLTAAGEPVADVSVVVYGAEGVTQWPVDDAGVFHMDTPIDGPAVLAALVDGEVVAWQELSSGANDVRLTPGQMGEPARVVRVVDDAGEPCPDAAVQVRVTRFGRTLGRWVTRTDADGLAEITGHLGGSLLLTVTPGAGRQSVRVTLREADDAGRPVRVVCPTAQPTVGRVVDEAGQPVAGAGLFLGTVRGGVEPQFSRSSLSVSEDDTAWEQTDAAGVYTLDRLTDGSAYTFVVVAEGYLPALTDRVVPGQQVPAVVLRRPVTLTGRLVGDWSESEVEVDSDGEGLPAVRWVQRVPTPTGRGEDRRGVAEVTVDDDGVARFEADGLWPHAVQVWAGDAPGELEALPWTVPGRSEMVVPVPARVNPAVGGDGPEPAEAEPGRTADETLPPDPDPDAEPTPDPDAAAGDPADTRTRRVVLKLERPAGWPGLDGGVAELMVREGRGRRTVRASIESGRLVFGVEAGVDVRVGCTSLDVPGLGYGLERRVVWLDLPTRAERDATGRASGEPEVLTLPLQRAGLLAGRVLDGQGQPVRGAVVAAQPRERGLFTPNYRVRTDGAGRFVMHPMRMGVDYDLTAQWGATGAAQASFADVQLEPFTEEAPIQVMTLRMRPIEPVRVRVVSDAGEPVAGALVRLMARVGTATRMDTGYTDALGRVALRGVPVVPGLDAVGGVQPATLTVTDMARHPDWSGPARAGVAEQVVSVDTGRTLSGLAVHAHTGRPLSYIRINASRQGGAGRRDRVQGLTDAWGRFTWEGLRPGTYGFLVRDDGWHSRFTHRVPRKRGYAFSNGALPMATVTDEGPPAAVKFWLLSMDELPIRKLADE